MRIAGALAGRRLLVVEDEYFIADDIVEKLRRQGALVIGPAGSLEDALELASMARLDGAILDLNLRGEMAFPVADALKTRRVPFLFATGYDRSMLPVRFVGVPHCIKPIDASCIARMLFGAPVDAASTRPARA